MIATAITRRTATTEHSIVLHMMTDGTIYRTSVDLLLGIDELPDGRPMPYSGHAYLVDGDEWQDIIGQPLFDRCDRELAHHLYRLVVDHYCDGKEEPNV